ncbi:MAG TPA: DNA repair protein RadA [Acidimicrobiales bacterium]|nr:DNA repair protein RadA [Acidimicrobiales bacterium]
MARLRATYRCNECGTAAPQWAGRCAACEAWNSLVEEVTELVPGPVSRGGTLPVLSPATRPVALASIDPQSAPMRSTGVAELDRVLGGGLMPGSVTLLGGEPGIGKSTLLLQALCMLAGRGATCLLVSAEESAAQVRARAERLGSLPPTLLLQCETSLAQTLAAIETIGPDVCAIDSIQTVFDPDLSGSAGSVLQVTECTQALTRVAKDRGMCCLLVGHVTKDGTLAGPRILEHLVDTVLAFDGDRHHSLRLLRAVKHRFGPTGELGLFEMGDGGLRGVPDASALLLGDRRSGIPGSVIVPALEGRRTLLVEVQALVSRSSLAQPRRSAQGLDGGRLSLLLAVLQRRARINLGQADVYVSAVGGVRVIEPAADLAVALALASAVAERPLPPDLVALGEIGLGGELRQAHQSPRRLTEAARLGFNRAIVPASLVDAPGGMHVERVATLANALDAVGIDPAMIVLR